MKDWQRARRELLGRLGLGAACLPLLRATGARAQTPPRKKLICILGIHGYRQPAWRPALGPLRDQVLPASTSPLAPHKEDLLFVTGLRNPAGGGDGGYGIVFWGQSDVVGGGSYKEPNGKTVDQVAASARPAATGAIPSLALGVQLDLLPHASTARGASSCFWQGPGMPITPELDPTAVFARLFVPRTPGEGGVVNRLRFQRKSLLDYVGGSLERFARRVGSTDRDHVQAHLAAVRALEQRLPATRDPQQCNTPPPAVDLASSAGYPHVLRAELELMLAALTCGITDVATLQLADATGTSINFGAFVPGLPATSKNNYKTPYRNWADLANNPIMDGVDHKQLVDQWFMTRFAELLFRLKQIPDADGASLFDNTIVLWANPVEEGASKNAQAMPWIIAAKRGVLRTGQHVAAAGQAASLALAAICRALGLPGEPFGRPLPELLA
jgi:hypothetical protein